ncbi:hypothetical protein [Desulfosarcina sp.]|nr:hypothetical protein [Desulfosarcina sp.]MDX2455277.1 hypothetical protein [Desulfosarcina sp.]MDX2492811.1 hypothetical protein [Desulfosarcina sp.]
MTRIISLCQVVIGHPVSDITNLVDEKYQRVKFAIFERPAG